MARSLKFKLGTVNGKKLVRGLVEYHKDDQRELQYDIERIETIGALEMIAHTYHQHENAEDESEDSEFAFPGFVWTIIMRR